MAENMSIEQEIVQLQQQLEAKKAQLEAKPDQQETIPHDKEILHEVVKEKIQQHTVQQSQPASVPAVTVPDTSTPTYLTPELQTQVQQLVNVAFTKNISDAIQEAVKTKNPALIDAFHDVLVDELYGQLLERKKIEPLS